MYRPNFCAECGTRVERALWRVWTSRRFCPECERRAGRRGMTAALAACTSLLAIGFGLGRALRPAAPPLIIERKVTTDVLTARGGTKNEERRTKNNNEERRT